MVPTDAPESDGIDPIRVVHADDDPEFLELTRTVLERDFPAISVTSETDASAALERVRAGECDCVLLDYVMPEMDGLAFLERVRDTDAALPVVFFTGQGSEALAADAIRAGVTDYVPKEASASRFSVLGSRIVTLVLKRRAELAAEATAAREHEVYERLDAGYLRLDDAFTVTDANGRAARVLDLTDDVVGADFFAGVPGFTDTVFETELRRVAAAGEPASVEGYCAARERWYRLFAYPDREGLSVFLDDVTDEVVTEAELERIRRDLELTEADFRTLRRTLSRPPTPFS